MHDPGPRQDGHPASEFSVDTDEVTCQQFVELVTDYFEGSLGVRTLGHVEEHLVMCDWCVTYVEQMRSTTELLRTLHEPATREPGAALLAALAAQAGGGG